MHSQLRILILRSDNIGDAVIFTGALRALRAHWPQAQIDLMVTTPVRPLFAHCPYVDRVFATHRLLPWLAWRHFVARGSWAFERLMLHPSLRRWWYPRHQLVIYPVSAPIESFLRAVRLMPAAEKWGYAGDQLRLYDLEYEANRPENVFTRAYVNPPADRWQHEQERTRRFLQFYGVDPGDLRPELWLSRRDVAFAKHALSGDSPLAFFIGAGSVLRQWPAAKWAELATRQTVTRDVVLLGGKADRAIAATLTTTLTNAGLRVCNLVGKTRLGELAACISRCKVVVSNDSSGLHLAVAAGVPAVGILGGYHFGRFYPWGDPQRHRIANVPMDCYHCNDACKFGDWRCVRDIPVDRVLQELAAAAASAPLPKPTS
ncbi:MAG: glycosyltransferase family 9 protein [Verrucomicrobia bacterium]|nr:glycosyltransferase family 9 protein [Verrucomicrobiota bacterium]